MLFRRLLALLVLSVILATGAYAQEAGEQAGEQAELPAASDRIERLKQALEEQREIVAPDVVPAQVLDEDGQAAMRQSFKAYYEYRTQGYEHRKGVFEWQLFSSKVIFGLVVAIVLVGLYFSWLQFHAGFREKAAAADTATTIEAGTAGIKVSSPVLGVIILTLSLAFFYLYLVHVYPIEDIF